MIELYKNIKDLREQKGLSQDELAKLTGYTSRSSIAKIEKGEVDLTRSKIIAFAKALDTTPGNLIGWCKTSDSVNEKEQQHTQDITKKYSLPVQTLLDKSENLNSDGIKELHKYADYLLSQEQYQKLKTQERAM